MIDKNARLFGRLNIIDFCILLGLAGLLAFGIMQFRSGRGLIGGESREFIISFFTEEIEDWAVTGMRVGDDLFDHMRGLYLGVVTDIQIAPSIVWNADQHGNTVRSTKEGFSSLLISARVTGTLGDHGVMVAGNRYGVGMNIPIRAGGYAVFTRVSGLQEVPR